MAADPAGGYWTATPGGAVTSHTGAPAFGSPAQSDLHLNQPIVGIAATPDGRGYWLVASDGGIFSYGDAAFFGSTGNLHLNQPIVGMSSTPDGLGYWLVASDGGIFSFGDASFFGSTGNLHLNQPIVGMAATPSGQGYWLVASDGGIFTFGDASFFGSTGNVHLNKPIMAMTPSSDGHGYWMVASDGGIFAFGDASFAGSLAGQGVTAIGIIVDPDSPGYTLVESGGTVAPFASSGAGTPTGPAATPSFDSSWVQVGEDNFTLGTSHPNWGIYSTDINPENDFSASNVSFVDGEADVTTAGGTSGGMCWCKNEPETLYGRWQLRAKFDQGSDQTPVFLMWPTNNVWPSGGEIDWIQSFSSVRASLLYSLHWGATNSQSHQSATGDFSGWHTYSLEWEPNDITVWVDGIETFHTTDPSQIPHDPMYLAIQASPVDTSAPATPSTIHVDWVKVFAP
jgi:hypothetical protein